MMLLQDEYLQIGPLHIYNALIAMEAKGDIKHFLNKSPICKITKFHRNIIFYTHQLQNHPLLHVVKLHLMRGDVLGHFRNFHQYFVMSLGSVEKELILKCS